MSAREIIAKWIRGYADREACAVNILADLSAAGYRILAPGEVDAETVEQCIKELNKLPWFEDVVSLADVEAALRALKAEGRNA